MFEYFLVYQCVFSPFELKQMKFLAKTDKDAIKKADTLYFSQKIKEVRRKINEQNILLIFSNKNFNEQPQCKTGNKGTIKRKKRKTNCKANQ